MTIQPLPLTPEEKAVIKDYIQTYNHFQNVGMDSHEYGDAEKLIDSLKSRLLRLYKDIPQIVKDEQLIPPPY